jgi:hypothetical protein
MCVVSAYREISHVSFPSRDPKTGMCSKAILDIHRCTCTDSGNKYGTTSWRGRVQQKMRPRVLTVFCKVPEFCHSGAHNALEVILAGSGQS